MTAGLVLCSCGYSLSLRLVPTLWETNHEDIKPFTIYTWTAREYGQIAWGVRTTLGCDNFTPP